MRRGFRNGRTMRTLDELIDKTDSCWNWLGYTEVDGYGRINFKDIGRKQAHRYVYEQLVGPIPEGLTLDHLCSNRRCVRPAHLDPVPIAVNVLRGRTLTAANAAKTECHKGHPFSPENTRIIKRGDRVKRECSICAHERWRQSATRWRARQAVA